MKKASSGGKPVTFSQLNAQLKQAFESFGKQIDKRFAGVDKKLATLDGKITASMALNAINIDRAINALEERQNKKFDAILARMDAFIKRTEVNEREITFLGSQHDNLAKYCHEKIAYPEYGR